MLVWLGLGVLAPALPLFAQQPKVARIGLLWIKQDGPPTYVRALRDGLRAYGYEEGKNIQIDDRFLVNGYEQIPEAAGRLVGERPDAIVTWGGTATVAVHKATASIPIVMVSAGDPVKLGLVASLAKPGGNVTGMTSISSDLSGKRLELLKELVPGLRRVAVVLHKQSQSEVNSLRQYEDAARALNLEVRAVDVASRQEIEPVVAGIAGMDVHAVAFVGSTLFIANMKRVVAAAGKVGLPAVYTSADYVAEGGLMGYSANIPDAFRRSAAYIDKILKGAKPGDLPIEQPTNFELAINLKTAKALGLAVPRSILTRSDRVVE